MFRTHQILRMIQFKTRTNCPFNRKTKSFPLVTKNSFYKKYVKKTLEKNYHKIRFVKNIKKHFLFHKMFFLRTDTLNYRNRVKGKKPQGGPWIRGLSQKY